MTSFQFTAEDVERKLGWQPFKCSEGGGSGGSMFKDRAGEIKDWHDAEGALKQTSVCNTTGGSDDR